MITNYDLAIIYGLIVAFNENFNCVIRLHIMNLSSGIDY